MTSLLGGGGGEEDGEGEEEEGGEGGGGGWKNKAKLGKSTSSYLQFCDSYAQNAAKERPIFRCVLASL